MSIIKTEQIEFEETEHKTRRKFKHAGTLRLENALINTEHKTAMDILIQICEIVDCNFTEVLDAVNRTVR